MRTSDICAVLGVLTACLLALMLIGTLMSQYYPRRTPEQVLVYTYESCIRSSLAYSRGFEESLAACNVVKLKTDELTAN